MPPARFVRLTPEEDARLRAVEQDPTSNPKCDCAPRCCASRTEARPSRGSPPTPVAARRASGETSTPLGGTGLLGPGRRESPRQPAAHNRGGEGFHGGEARRAGEGLERHTTGRGGLAEGFGIGVTPEAIRQHLVAMGSRWKRTRYVPSKESDPEEEGTKPEKSWRR